MKTGESGVSQEREWRGANEHELREKIEEGGWRKDATEEGEGVGRGKRGSKESVGKTAK